MTFALAVTHPEALAAALLISGLLPPSLYSSAALSSRPRPATLPPVAAFHGALPNSVDPKRVRLDRRATARLVSRGAARVCRVEHDTSEEKERALVELIGRAAAGLSTAALEP